MKLITALFFALCFMSSGVHAMSAENLVKKCKQSLQSTTGETAQQTTARILDVGSCAGFVGGVASGANLVGAMMKQQGIISKDLFCIPSGVDAPKLLSLVESEIGKNASAKKQSAQFVIYTILTREYPCP